MSETHSQWDCFACGRAGRMTHSGSLSDGALKSLAKQQHDSRQRGFYSRCRFRPENARIVRDVAPNRWVAHEHLANRMEPCASR